MKAINIESIITDMNAAGCSAEDADMVKRIYEAGMEEEISRRLRKCRCRLIEEMHEKQRNVDRLDTLIRKTQQLGL